MAVEIMLSDKQKNEIQKELYGLIKKSIEEAKDITDVNRKNWMRKSDVVQYLPMSNNSIDAKLAGLPYHNIDGIILYNKKEIDDFILNK